MLNLFFQEGKLTFTIGGCGIINYHTKLKRIWGNILLRSHDHAFYCAKTRVVYLRVVKTRNNTVNCKTEINIEYPASNLSHLAKSMEKVQERGTPEPLR